jgi:PAS domain S-box-containing protein
MVSASGEIEMVNAQAERMFGYTRAEMLGSRVEMLMPLAFRAKHPRLRAGFGADPTPRPMGAGTVLFGQRKDGSQFELEIGLNPIETDDGIMVLSAIVDISARVQMAEQLRQSQKMDAIGRVTAGVAHDFNNLLQALGGSLELLLDTVADQPTATEWAQVAMRAVKRGGELTGRMLAFSRQQVLTARAVQVRKLLTDVGELISHMFETKPNERNEIIVLPGRENLAVLADGAQLEAALLNLAVNARDAMPLGGRLRISAYEADGDPAIVSPGRYIVISVADTGTGMDAATIAQCCDPFFTTKGPKGTGLGLSMVQGFARQSGGDAHIFSVVGEGTTVELWLPSATAAPTIAPPTLEPVSVRGHILLVDDSPDVLLTVGSFLRKAGLQVTCVASGDLAMGELLGGRRFSAIVTDFAMPGLNGIDLLVQAREIDRSLPAMIITGFYDPEVLSGLENVVVMRKPFNRAELIEQVQKMIGAPGADLIAGERHTDGAEIND